MASPVRIGIMTRAINSAERFGRYARAAIAEGFDEVVLFTPHAVDLVHHSISGFVYHKNGIWRRQASSIPGINLDIGYYTSPRDVRAAIQVKNKRSILFTGYGLGNKWNIQKHLLNSPMLLPHVLPTLPVKSVSEVLTFLEDNRTIMLKPINGTGGQGIIRLSVASPSVEDKSGRVLYYSRSDHSEQTYITRKSIAAYISRIIRRGPHLMQRWIDIRNVQGQVFDIRALTQKNGNGKWQVSGMAVREGKINKITSNLKTGGRAYDACGYLVSQFGEERGMALSECSQLLASHIPEHLEASYGINLSELGIDLAVDRDGSLWLIEVNIKPGRKVIQQVFGPKAYQRCFRNPFRYARYMLRTRHDAPEGSISRK